MGSVFNRGTRGSPNWYLKYKDEQGRWRAVPSHQPTKTAARQLLAQIESNIAKGRAGLVELSTSPSCGPLMEEWASGLHNRSARDDRTRLTRHVLPRFQDCPIAHVDLAMLMTWLDEQRASGSLSDASVRHNLNILSRFFSWAVERGHSATNPVRLIPTGKRPRQTRKQAVPYIDDDRLVARIIDTLPGPIDLMFYLGNRSGLRTGEICGLRLSDCGFLADGVIRVRYSYLAPLKEDKENIGKAKWVPAGADCQTLLDPWLRTRSQTGAGPEDLLFPGPTEPAIPYNKRYIERKWDEIRDRLGLTLTWYQATRHSFVSSRLANGASLDEVSDAVGHSSPVVTRRYYDHFVRRSYTEKVRAPALQLPSQPISGNLPSRPARSS